MTTEELKNELGLIIKKYVDEENIALNLIDNISNDGVKGILAEIDRHKTRAYEKEDIETIKDIYFNFC